MYPNLKLYLFNLNYDIARMRIIRFNSAEFNCYIYKF